MDAGLSPSQEVHKQLSNLSDDDEKFNGGSVGGDSDGGSETEGFVSGEEDFDSERAFVRGVGEAREDDSHVKLVNSSEFLYPGSLRPVAKVSVDDDDEEDDVEDSKLDDLGGEDVARDLKTVVGESSVENLGTNGGVLADDGLGESANLGGLVKENGSNGSQEHVVEAVVSGEVDKGSENLKFVQDGVGSVVEGSPVVPEKQLEVTEIENKKDVEPEGSPMVPVKQSEVTEIDKKAVDPKDCSAINGSLVVPDKQLVVTDIENKEKDVEPEGSLMVPEKQSEVTEIDNKKAVEPKDGSAINATSKVVSESRENSGVAREVEGSTTLDGVDEHQKSVVVEPADDKLVEELAGDKLVEESAVAKLVEENGVEKLVAGVAVEVDGSTTLDDVDEHQKSVVVEPADDKLVEELAGDKLVEESADAKLVEENGVEKLVAEPADDKLAEEPADDKLAEEPADDKLVEEHGVDFTSGGDSIAQGLHVNLSHRGAAVVDDVQAIEESEVKGLEVPDGGVKLDNGFDQISRETDELNDSGLVAVDSESDKVVTESLNVELDGQKAVVAGTDEADLEERPKREVELKSDSETRQEGLTAKKIADEVEVVSDEKPIAVNEVTTQTLNGVSDLAPLEPEHEARPDNAGVNVHDRADELEAVVSAKSLAPEFVAPSSTEQGNKVEEEGQVKNFPDDVGSESVDASPILNREIRVEAEVDDNDHEDDDKDLQDYDNGLQGDDKDIEDYEEAENESTITDGNNEGMIFGSSDAAKQFLEELERGSGNGSYSGTEAYPDHSQRIDGQIVTESDEELDTDEEGGGKELFDSAALAALLKAATGASSDGRNVTFTHPDGSGLFSVERPAGLGSSIRSLKPAARPNNSSIFSNSPVVGESEDNLSEEERAKLEKFQQIRVKFLRLVQRLGVSSEDSIARQVLYRLALVSGRQNSKEFSLEAARMKAVQLEAEGKDDLNLSLNILVLGKTGVGKSATINSIFGEEKTPIYAFGPATTSIKEINGVVDGVKIRVFDTPGLKSAAMEQGVNRKILSSVQRFTKKNPPDIVLYVDRLDTQSRDLNDVPVLKSITSAFGPSIWRSTIVTLTHGASAPPDGPSGSPLNYELFVAQRSQILQQTIGQAIGDLRFMSPSLMSPISLVENHLSCRKNRDGQKVLPNGQSWRPQLLLLCYSMKILSEATNLSKPQESFDQRKLFGLRSRSAPLPYLLSWLLQSRSHPKLASDQGGENADSDIDLADLSDSDQEEDEDEYDQLPSFKPLKKAQIAKLGREQKKAYVEEYDYRVKLLQKKMWREELRRMKEMKKGSKINVEDFGFAGEEDPENGGPAAVPVALPDMVLPPSFDSENPAYRYRFLEPTSQFVARPVLDAQGWDHDCGYDGVNLEQSLAIANAFPAAVAVQITKDKKEFNLHLDSSVAAKHGETGSSMLGFDIQHVGKQLAYIVRGDTKFKNLKKNKTAAGVSVTFLGENVSTGFKVEDQIALGKRLVLVGTTGTVRSQGESAYGANLEVRLREADFPIGQDQSSLGLSLVKWRGDTALGANFQSQFSLGRNYKMAVRAGLNNKLSGQISVRTSSSEQLQIALVAVLPIVKAICNTIWPGNSENYSVY